MSSHCSHLLVHHMLKHHTVNLHPIHFLIFHTPSCCGCLGVTSLVVPMFNSNLTVSCNEDTHVLITHGNKPMLDCTTLLGSNVSNIIGCSDCQASATTFFRCVAFVSFPDDASQPNQSAVLMLSDIIVMLTFLPNPESSLFRSLAHSAASVAAIQCHDRCPLPHFTYLCTNHNPNLTILTALLSIGS